MRMTIEIPDEYAEEVRRRLDLRGYNDSPAEVRRVLRFTITHHLTLWWGERHHWRFRTPNGDGTLGEEIPAIPTGLEQRRQAIVPVTAFGAINHPSEIANSATLER